MAWAWDAVARWAPARAAEMGATFQGMASETTVATSAFPWFRFQVNRDSGASERSQSSTRNERRDGESRFIARTTLVLTPVTTTVVCARMPRARAARRGVKENFLESGILPGRVVLFGERSFLGAGGTWGGRHRRRRLGREVPRK